MGKFSEDVIDSYPYLQNKPWCHALSDFFFHFLGYNDLNFDGIKPLFFFF